jgi:hypothetical protein
MNGTVKDSVVNGRQVVHLSASLELALSDDLSFIKAGKKAAFQPNFSSKNNSSAHTASIELKYTAGPRVSA